MDINYYLHREQVERSRAESARSDEARAAHRQMADLYRTRIQDYRAAVAERKAEHSARPPLFGI